MWRNILSWPSVTKYYLNNNNLKIDYDKDDDDDEEED